MADKDIKKETGQQDEKRQHHICDRRGEITAELTLVNRQKIHLRFLLFLSGDGLHENFFKAQANGS